MTKELDARKLEIRLVKTMEELRDAFRVRHRVFYGEHHFEQKEDTLDMEYDPFDLLEYTRIFNAYYDGEAVGSVRLILDSRYGFALEKEFNVFTEIKKQEGRIFTEGSRIAILPDYRMGKISWGLLKADVNLAISEGATDIFSAGNIGDVGFNVVEQVFFKMGYDSVGDISSMEGVESRVIPLHLKLENLKEPFKSILQKDTPYIEKPYNQVDL